MSLREQAIEAMAKASCESYSANELDDKWPWDAYGEIDRGLWLREAQAALDALLGFLNDHADEWGYWPYGGTIKRLLAVLSADQKEEEE